MAYGRLFTVRGRVQGVFFRDSTRRVAESLGLTGHAVNLPNGDVEVLACGAHAAIDELGRWLHEGPRMASVEGVSAREVDVDEPDGFRTG
jgi:acylphosphatase